MVVVIPTSSRASAICSIMRELPETEQTLFTTLSYYNFCHAPSPYQHGETSSFEQTLV